MINSFKCFTALFFFLFFTVVMAQKELVSSVMDLKEYESTQTLPIIDRNNNIQLFIYSKSSLYRTGITQITFDNNSRKLTQRVYDKPEELALKDVIGFHIDKLNTISLYYLDKKNIIRIVTNKNGALKKDSFDLNLNKEKIVQYISFENDFYLLTVQRNSSVINHYAVKGNNLVKKSFDFEDKKFFDKDNKITKLSKLLSFKSIGTILDSIDYRPSVYAKYTKIYPKKNELIITLDQQVGGTRVISLNLLNSGGTVDFYPISTTGFRTTDYPKSNTYLKGDLLVSLISSKSKLNFKVTNFESKEKLFENSFTEENGADFETSILGLNESQKNFSEKEKIKRFKKFIKSLANPFYVGVSMNKIKEKVVLSFGGYSSLPSNGGGFSVGTRSRINTSQGEVAVAGAPAIFNSFGGNNGYSGFDRKIVLNEDDFQLSEGSIFRDINYDLLTFKNKLEKSGLYTSFKYGNNYVFGYFSKKDKVYHLMKFEN